MANDLASVHAVREGLRRAGSTLILETVSSRSEFLSRLHSGPVDLVLAATSGLGGMPVTEIMRQATNLGNRVPLIVIGNVREGPEAFGTIQVGVWAYLDVSQLPRLPTTIERVLGERREGGGPDAGRVELEHAAELLRENQKLLTLGRLTASIVHEINNPLESLTNLLYLIEVDPDSGEKRGEYLKMAQQELNRVVQISRQTLTFSRETSTPVYLQLADLLEEVLVLYGRKIANKNIRVIRQYESSEDVVAYPGEIRQVFSNLIANAIEAIGGKGRLILRIREARKWSDRGVRGLRISVADNGSGIPSETLKRLGEAFFTTKGQAGTGLGLWVTHSILNRYGGSLRVRSSVSGDRHGTVFIIFIPTNMRPVAVVPGDSGLEPGSKHGKSVKSKHHLPSPEASHWNDDQQAAG